MRNVGGSGCAGDLINSILWLRGIWKFITYGVEITTDLPSAPFSLLIPSRKKKKKRNRHDPTRLGKACSYRRNKHIYGNTFHTFGCGVKGLGSVGELTDWISALAAGACFLTSNLEALWKKGAEWYTKTGQSSRASDPITVLWYETRLCMIRQSWSMLSYLSYILPAINKPPGLYVLPTKHVM